jgi:predicted nucleic acid-binding protein
MIVVDASVIVEALMNPSSAAAELLAATHSVLSPAHIDAEIGHALRGLVRGGVLTPSEAQRCLDDVAAGAITRAPLPPLLLRAFELSDNMTFYDALYVALAELHDIPLVTTDSKLARVPGVRCVVDVLPDAQ